MKKVFSLAGLLSVAICLLGQQQVMPIIGTPAGGSAVSYLYYGYGCNGTSSQSCTVGSITDGGGLTHSLAPGRAISTGSNAHGYDLAAYGAAFQAIDGTNKHFNMAVYDNNGLNLISHCGDTSNNVVSSTGVYTEVTFTGSGGTCHLAASTTYIIYEGTDGDGTHLAYDSGGAEYYNSDANAAYASHWAASMATPTSTSGNWSLYLKVTATP